MPVALHPEFESTMLSLNPADSVQEHVFDFILNIQKLGGVQIGVIEHEGLNLGPFNFLAFLMKKTTLLFITKAFFIINLLIRN